MSPKEQEIVLMLAIIHSRYHHFLRKKKTKSDQLLCSECVCKYSYTSVCMYCVFYLFRFSSLLERDRKKERGERGRAFRLFLVTDVTVYWTTNDFLFLYGLRAFFMKMKNAQYSNPTTDSEAGSQKSLQN